ncbi:signal recognition particle, SRP19 subunit [Hyaloscypha finlandica]|nr:signal recognition particle, SRP19 subunit [Hyaloscypha finlandica]
MSHARIEEVSDSDPSEGDISDVSDDFDEREILKQRAPPSVSQSIINPSSIPSTTNTTSSPPAPGQGQPFHTTQDESKYKDFQCIYPVYFDVNRSRAEGRRVGLELAVENPMAREIVNACARLRLETLFEPSKLHPKDWANPGRVKIKLKGGANKSIKNKHHLYTLISAHLKANPTTTATASLVRVPGVPPPDPAKEYPKPAIPKGWKMGNILPHYSPGLTGGGVSENFLKDMMAEMQNAGAAGAGAGGAGPSSGGGEPKEKKKKVKKIRA